MIRVSSSFEAKLWYVADIWVQILSRGLTVTGTILQSKMVPYAILVVETP